MPHSTYQYLFEMRIGNWAASFVSKLNGGNRGFLLLLDADGAIRQVYTGDHPSHFDHQLKETLTNQHSHWLFYDPFDAPEYTFIQWKSIEMSVFERFLKHTFEAADLCSSRSNGSLDRVPSSWEVMF